MADCNAENCTELIISFLTGEMQLDISSDQIARAHRLGSLIRSKASYQVPRRPIIVAFKDYSVTEMIMKAAKCLKGSRYRVERDFPNEIAEARQRLWPKFKEEREKHPRSRVTIAYPAKLIRNGRVIYDEFPDWFNVLRESRIGGFDSDSCEESDIENSQRVADDHGKVFRPWQGQSRSETQNWAYQADAEGDSDSSIGSSVYPLAQSEPRKNINIKTKTQEARPKDKKSSEKKTTGKENIISNQSVSKNQNNVKKQTESRKTVQSRKSESRNVARTSSLPDLTRGRSRSRSTHRVKLTSQPIGVEKQPHVRNDCTTNSFMNMNEHSNVESHVNINQ